MLPSLSSQVVTLLGSNGPHRWLDVQRADTTRANTVKTRWASTSRLRA